MNSEYLRKLGVDKIAFFALLVIGLLIASFIISKRTDFKLSEPIELTGRGVSVNLPIGGGFKQISDEFNYTNKEFRIASVFQAGQNMNISAHWRYFIVPIEQSFNEKAQSDATSINGHIEDIGSVRFGDLTFEYAKIVSPQSATTVYIGNTILASGQTLALEVIQKAGSIDIAETLFSSLAESVKITEQSPLSKGIKLLTDFKNRSSLAGEEESFQNYYYIRNYTDTTIGFVADSFSFAGADDKPMASTYLFFIESGRLAFSQQGLFTASQQMKTFKWAASHSNLRINRDQPTSIILDENGNVTVGLLNNRQSFKISNSMIPESVIDVFISDFVRGAEKKVMLDLILSDGSIAPVLIEQIAPNKGSALNAAWAAKAVFYNGSATSQKMYFGINGELLLSEVHGKLSYKVVRADRDEIINKFCQWSEKIQQTESYLIQTD